MQSVPRSYQSRVRADQARRTRLAIVKAALKLFLENGYSATSIRAIAREAGVAEPTVYLAFHDKVSILRAIAEHAFYGETEEGAGHADFIETLASVPDPAERLRSAIHQTAIGYAQGLAKLGRVIGSAVQAEPRLQEFAADMIDRRHRDIRDYLGVILGREVPTDQEGEQLIDEVEVHTSDEVYWILAVERGWSIERYEAYVVDMCLTAMRRHGVDPRSMG
jgi:AcrR family transcriptional regulator